MTRPSFLWNKFWPVIRASQNRMSLSLQHTANSLPPRFFLFFNHRQPSTFHFFTNRRCFPSTPLMRLKSPEYLQIFAYPNIFGHPNVFGYKMFYPHTPTDYIFSLVHYWFVSVWPSFYINRHLVLVLKTWAV